MRIFYVGDFQGKNDEGMRHISKMIVNHIAKRQFVYFINTRDVLSIKRLFVLQRFKPDIIHYLTGPTLRSLVILKVYKLLFASAKTVSSAVRPFFSGWQQNWIRRFKPNLFLTQDPRWEKIFQFRGAAVSFLPNGVDTMRFHPVSAVEKISYRKKYGLPLESRIILHVGHLRQNRNLQLLLELQTRGVGQVVVVSGTAMKQDVHLRQLLKSAGCIVIDTYQKEIEQIYAAADVYAFPVLLLQSGELPQKYNQVGVIDMPLSVLEAMASNLQVITVPFPALRRSLPAEIQGLRWFDGTVENFQDALNQIEDEETQTRQPILAYDWAAVAHRLEKKYENLIAGTILQSSGKS